MTLMQAVTDLAIACVDYGGEPPVRIVLTKEAFIRLTPRIMAEVNTTSHSVLRYHGAMMDPVLTICGVEITIDKEQSEA